MLLFVVCLLTVCFVLWLLGRHYTQAVWGLGWIDPLDGLNRFICYVYHGVEPGCFDLPSEGPLILAANHIAGIDPFAVAAKINRPIRFMIDESQYHRPVARRFFKRIACIPVNTEGRGESGIREARMALARGEVVMIFPYGDFMSDEEHLEAEIHPGVALLASVSQALVYPIHVGGVRPSSRKTVVRSLLLPNRMKVTIGEPLTCDKRDKAGFLVELHRRITALAG